MKGQLRLHIGFRERTSPAAGSKVGFWKLVIVTNAPERSVVNGCREMVSVLRPPCDWVDCEINELLKPATASGCALPVSFCMATTDTTALSPLDWTEIDGENWPSSGLVTTKENLTVAPAGMALTTKSTSVPFPSHLPYPGAPAAADEKKRLQLDG